MQVVNVNQNSKTSFTRKCIAEAILDLLKHNNYEKITVSAIIKRAGVARMTFYRYYNTVYDALVDYLGIIISEYIVACEKEQTRATYMSYEHIVYSLKFFDQYASFFLILKEKNLYSIMIEGINQFMEAYIQTEKKISVYELYSYAGGLLNTFLRWEENGKKETPEEIGMIIMNLYHSVV